MAERRPLVIKDGQIQELPTGDTVPGGGSGGGGGGTGTGGFEDSLELLTNPGFETGDLTGWDAVSGRSSWIVATDTTAHSGSILPYAGSYLVHGGALASVGAQQTIDVSSYAENIDNGSMLFKAQAALANDYTIAESGYFEVVCLDALDNPLLEYASVDARGLTLLVWHPLALTGFIPKLTRKIIYRLIGIRRDGSQNNIVADAASFKLVKTVGGSSKPWFWKPPLAASFPTAIGSGVTTLTDDSDVGMIFKGGTPVSGDRVSGFVKALPSGDWVFTGRVVGGISSYNYSGMGFALTNAAKSKTTFFMLDGRGLEGANFNLPSGFSSDFLFEAMRYFTNPFLRLSYVSATNTVTFSTSTDGKAFAVHSSVVLSFLTAPAFAGPAVFYNRKGGAEAMFSCDHWEQSW